MKTNKKIVADLDNATHVIIAGKEYPRFRLGQSEGDPLGHALALGMPIDELHVRDYKDKQGKDKQFKYYFQIGSGQRGKRFGNLSFLCRLNPLAPTAPEPDADGFTV